MSEKDQHVLWSRAAGRCSFPGCRLLLTHDKTDGDPTTIAQMAHIVAESEGGARWKSLLTEAERAGYSNRILLCPNHHALIDKDPDAYPIELLHSYKAAHEMWVEVTLTAGNVDHDQLVYADVVDKITLALRLERWPTFTEAAVNDRLLDFAPEALPMLAHIRLATIWPGKLESLERCINDLIDGFTDYIVHFMGGSEWAPGRGYTADHSYRRERTGNYHDQRAEEERWSQINYLLLKRLTVRVNDFADQVRALLNPLYFRLEGRFLIVDSFGTWHDGDGALTLPHGTEHEAALAELGWVSTLGVLTAEE